MTSKGTLILVAHQDNGHAVGLHEALTNAGERDIRTVHLGTLPGLGAARYMEHVLNQLCSHTPAYVYVLWSPEVSYLSGKQLTLLKAILSEAQVLYLQYEGWGRGKPVTSAVRFWLQTADTVLHSGGIWALSRYTNPRAHVVFVPPCYSHTAFGWAEETPPGPPPSNHVVMIANNVTKSAIPIPGITGIGDGFSRWLTAAMLHKRLGRKGFHLYGANWPASWSRGTTSFSQQVDVMRAGSVVTISDHFQSRLNYASDRLPIAMLSGRPIVSSRVRAGIWLPSELEGLTFENGVASLVFSTQALLARTEQHSFQETPQTWEWVRKRLSTIQLGMCMVDQIFPGAYPNLPFPWGISDNSSGFAIT